MWRGGEGVGWGGGGERFFPFPFYKLESSSLFFL